MYRLLAAHHAAQHLDRAVRDHLVGVHVRLGARSGLPNHQGKVVVELAVDHFLRRCGDGSPKFGVDVALIDVDQRTGLLDDPQRADDRHRLPFPTDRKVDDGALCLGAPVFVGRHLQRAKAVGLGAECGHRWAS